MLEVSVKKMQVLHIVVLFMASLKRSYQCNKQIQRDASVGQLWDNKKVVSIFPSQSYEKLKKVFANHIFILYVFHENYKCGYFTETIVDNRTLFLSKRVYRKLQSPYFRSQCVCSRLFTDGATYFN